MTDKEIIRCEDCIHFIGPPYEYNIPNTNEKVLYGKCVMTSLYGEKFQILVKLDHYCGFGEKNEM